MEKANELMNGFLKPLAGEKVQGTMLVFFILYGSAIAPELPAFLKMFFDETFVKVIFLSLLFWSDNSNPILSIIMASVLALTFRFINKGLQTKEEFTLIHPKHRILSGCDKVKLQDLIDVFDGDSEKLEQTIRSIGVPYNVPLDDHHAPEIATFLINYGYSFGSKFEECNIAPGEHEIQPK